MNRSRNDEVTETAALEGIVFDLDGVLYSSGHPVKGAADVIQWAQQQEIPHLFLSNTARSRYVIRTQLASFGFNVPESSILTPAIQAVDWLRCQNATGVALFVPAPTRCEFAELRCLPEDAERGASHVVVGDIGDEWSFQKLNRAFRLLHNNPDSILVAMGSTRYWQHPDGLTLDVGPFVEALRYAVCRDPIVIGKPTKGFFTAGADRLSLPTHRVLMVGDDIEIDVEGAQAAGMYGALVKTGKFRPADLNRGIRPFAILDSVAGIPALWRCHSRPQHEK